ncbi:unnamed protein product [Prunus armeniaca]
MRLRTLLTRYTKYLSERGREKIRLLTRYTKYLSRGYLDEELGGQEKSTTTEEQGNSKFCSFGNCIANFI